MRHRVPSHFNCILPNVRNNFLCLFSGLNILFIFPEMETTGISETLAVTYEIARCHNTGYYGLKLNSYLRRNLHLSFFYGCPVHIAIIAVCSNSCTYTL